VSSSLTLGVLFYGLDSCPTGTLSGVHRARDFTGLLAVEAWLRWSVVVYIVASEFDTDLFDPVYS
jgi:hypothetical protein